MKVWTQEPEKITGPGMIYADAISDLQTTDNCLSTWFVGEKSEDDLKRGVSALTAGFRSLDDIKIVFLNVDDLLNNGFEIEQTEGDTPIEAYKYLHREIVNLNAENLLIFAKEILEGIRIGNSKDIHIDTITMWLLECLNDGKLKFKSVNKNMRAQLAPRILKMEKREKLKDNDLTVDVREAINEQIKINKKKTNCDYEFLCGYYRKLD